MLEIHECHFGVVDKQANSGSNQREQDVNLILELYMYIYVHYVHQSFHSPSSNQHL